MMQNNFFEQNKKQKVEQSQVLYRRTTTDGFVQEYQKFNSIEALFQATVKFTTDQGILVPSKSDDDVKTKLEDLHGKVSNPYNYRYCLRNSGSEPTTALIFRFTSFALNENTGQYFDKNAQLGNEKLTFEFDDVKKYAYIAKQGGLKDPVMMFDTPEQLCHYLDKFAMQHLLQGHIAKQKGLPYPITTPFVEEEMSKQLGMEI